MIGWAAFIAYRNYITILTFIKIVTCHFFVLICEIYKPFLSFSTPKLFQCSLSYINFLRFKGIWCVHFSSAVPFLIIMWIMLLPVLPLVQVHLLHPVWYHIQKFIPMNITLNACVWRVHYNNSYSITYAQHFTLSINPTSVWGA